MGHGLQALTYFALLAVTLGGNATQGSTPTATEVAKLAAAEVGVGRDGALFGSSVAIDGDTAVVGAPDEGHGAVYVFTRSNGEWSFQQRLVNADDGYAGGSFGRSLAIEGDTAVIAAPGCPADGSGMAVVDVFVRTNGVWSQQLRLGAGPCSRGFGGAVALSGDTALVGSPGEYYGIGVVYAFTRINGTWTGYQVLEPSALTPTIRFGAALALDGDTALIGAPGDSDSGAGAGAAYVFKAVDGVWFQQQKLLAGDGGANGAFGNAVALQGSTALVGAYWGDANGAGPGSAYVFTESGGAWMQQQKLIASDGVYGDHFGLSVALDGDMAAIGSRMDDDNGVDSGSAYVFNRSGAFWNENIKLLASDGASHDHFGGAFQGVSISGRTVLVGAYYHDSIGSDDGAVYVFELDKTPPVIQPTVSGTLRGGGWYVSDVNVSWAVTDPESIVATSTGCSPSVVNTDTVGRIFQCAATSAGGTSIESVVIKRDATLPVVSVSISPSANQYGWWNQAVTITVSGTDETSGIYSCGDTNPFVVSTEQSGLAWILGCLDNAWNNKQVSSGLIRIDMTPPAITVQAPSDGAVYKRKQKVIASYSCADALSGVVTCVGAVANGQPIDTSAKVKNANFVISAVDRAGNVATRTLTYTVK